MTDQVPRYIRAVYERQRLPSLLRAFGFASVFATVTVFVLFSALLLIENAVLGIAFILASAVSFAIVTLMRRAVNAPRPYEIYTMPDGFFHKGLRDGCSFPSRHVFSSFLIGTLILPYSAGLGAAVVAFGFLLGACRVLLGIHFLRDVIAGALIGVFFGAISIIIVSYCL